MRHGCDRCWCFLFLFNPFQHDDGHFETSRRRGRERRARGGREEDPCLQSHCVLSRARGRAQHSSFPWFSVVCVLCCFAFSCWTGIRRHPGKTETLEAVAAAETRWRIEEQREREEALAQRRRKPSRPPLSLPRQKSPLHLSSSSQNPSIVIQLNAEPLAVASTRAPLASSSFMPSPFAPSRGLFPQKVSSAAMANRKRKNREKKENVVENGSKLQMTLFVRKTRHQDLPGLHFHSLLPRKKTFFFRSCLSR